MVSGRWYHSPLTTHQYHEDIPMNPIPNTISRRDALKSASVGFGYLAFAGLSTWAAEKDNPLAPKKTHFPPKAKHVIFLCMEGAPSHVDTFDYKPKLAADNGKSGRGARGFAGRILPSPSNFEHPRHARPS